MPTAAAVDVTMLCRKLWDGEPQLGVEGSSGFAAAEDARLEMSVFFCKECKLWDEQHGVMGDGRMPLCRTCIHSCIMTRMCPKEHNCTTQRHLPRNMLQNLME